MNAIARFWRDLPFPVQILLGIVGGFALFQLFSGLGWLLVPLAALLWVLVLAGLGYALGWLRPSGPPVLVTALVRLTGGQPGVAGAHRTATVPLAGSRAANHRPPLGATPPDQAERERLLRDVQAALGELRGVDRAKEQLGELVEKVKAQRNRGASGFGTDAPGVVLLITGPRGVGKTTLARQIAPLFCGLGAIATPHTEEAGTAVLSPRLGGSMIERVRALAERSLDGVLLLDDMDWIAHPMNTTGPNSAADLGPTLTAIAQANPGRLVVVMTISGDAADRLYNNLEWGAWLRKLMDRRINFKPLPLDVLADLLRVQIERRHYRMLPAAEQRANKLLEKLATGVDFDNATAVRRLADCLTQNAAARSARQPGQVEVDPEDRYSISDADVRACERPASEIEPWS
ncbi:MAG: AAA family ATPase [Chromatiaceae bacterium]|nr:AAA family ATPase [Chromatiaceae bacterium]